MLARHSTALGKSRAVLITRGHVTLQGPSVSRGPSRGRPRAPRTRAVRRRPCQWLPGPLQQPAQGVAVDVVTPCQPDPQLHALDSRAGPTLPPRATERTFRPHRPFPSHGNLPCTEAPCRTLGEGARLRRQAGSWLYWSHPNRARNFRTLFQSLWRGRPILLSSDYRSR